MYGKKVTLRPVEPEDYPLLHAWQNDEEIAHWMDYQTPLSLADVEHDQDRARREGHPFVIELDGRPIGKCGLNQFRQDVRTCAMYIYVGEKGVWSQGIGRDAVMTLLCVAFDEHELDRVELTRLVDNDRARRVYEHCGFVPQGVLRGRSYRGGWHDTAVMSVVRGDFNRVRAEYGL